MPRIEEFFLPTDGNDWLPAINRAQQEFHTPGDPTGTPGFTLEFGPSQYFFSDTIRLVRSLRLVGAAGSMIAPVAGRLADKRGTRFVLTAAMSLLAFSYLLLWGGERASVSFAASATGASVIGA